MSVLDTIRRRFHPLHHLRKSQMFRAFCARFDRLKMMRVAGVAFPIAGYFLKNFNMVLGRSLHEAETLKWFERLAGENDARVFWDVGANDEQIPPRAGAGRQTMAEHPGEHHKANGADEHPDRDNGQRSKSKERYLGEEEGPTPHDRQQDQHHPLGRVHAKLGH